MLYHVKRNDENYGPYTLEDLQRYVASGNVLPTDLAKSEGMTEWVPVAQVLGDAMPAGWARDGRAICGWRGAGLSGWSDALSRPSKPALGIGAADRCLHLRACSSLSGTSSRRHGCARCNPRSNAIFYTSRESGPRSHTGFQIRIYLVMQSGMHLLSSASAEEPAATFSARRSPRSSWRASTCADTCWSTSIRPEPIGLRLGDLGDDILLRRLLLPVPLHPDQ